jgi:hypothetical protein
MAVMGFPVSLSFGRSEMNLTPVGRAPMLPPPIRPNFAASAGACLWKQTIRPDFLRKASNGCTARKAAGAWLLMNEPVTKVDVDAE